jgi:hypothetical protein
MVKRKSKVPVNVQVTGRAVAYIQPVGRGGKLGKAKPVMLTTVRVAPGGAAAKKRRRRRG